MPQSAIGGFFINFILKFFLIATHKLTIIKVSLHLMILMNRLLFIILLIFLLVNIRFVYFLVLLLKSLFLTAVFELLI